MSKNPLPDFERTLAIAQGNLEASELSECHGVACALLCRDPEASLDVFLGLLDMLELVQSPGSGFRISLEELLDSSRMQLSDEDMGLSLWLPDEDETLEDRTMSMAQWCSGFLAGLGGDGEEPLNAMTDDAKDALRDLQQISTADVTDTTESEEDEVAFAEIVEYIRVVVLMIREDLRGPGRQDSIH